MKGVVELLHYPIRVIHWDIDPKVIRELAEKILSNEISFSDVVVPVVKEWRVEQMLSNSGL
jgi:hypothetical protein